MWTEIFLLTSLTTITIHARIDGLHNDPGTGYSYHQPEAVQASLAYYINIPANNEHNDHFYSSDQYIQYPSQYRRVPPQDFRGNSIYNGLGDISQQYNQAVPEPNIPLPPDQDLRGISHFNPYEQLDSSRHSIYQRPFPSIQNHHYTVHPSPSTSNHFQQISYQIDPRSRPHNPLPLPAINFPQASGYKIQPSIVEHIPSFKNSINQDYRQPPIPSQELIPPPYTPHVTLQIEPKSFEGSAPKQYRIVPSVASLPMSYNARLPFPIGTVPIKFRPLPLKTHLRQAGLLPITSYQARESYKK